MGKSRARVSTVFLMHSVPGTHTAICTWVTASTEPVLTVRGVFNRSAASKRRCPGHCTLPCWVLLFYAPYAYAHFGNRTI